jgi:hypothetical protein
MPYALIPDGYSLKKVTKLQKEAVNAKRRHDDVVALLNNPNTPVVIGGLVTAYFAANLADGIIKDLEETVGPIAEDTKSAIVETVDIRLSRPAALREAIVKGLSAFSLEGLKAELRG